MNFITTRVAAEKWGISRAIVRRYCTEGRIPYAKTIDGVWYVPEDAVKPGEAEKVLPKDDKPLPPLASRIVRQKKKKNYHEFYDYIVINLTYSSCRMASCRLTREQVSSIFKKNQIRESFEPLRLSELIEVMNHCLCVDYILDHVNHPLTQEFIKKLHSMLMYYPENPKYSSKKPGKYRDASYSNCARIIPNFRQIPDRLEALIQAYEKNSVVDFPQILDFHVHFEEICPFLDGNGRIGRLIMFKECLRHDVPPFILDDKRRGRYLDGIVTWDEDPSILIYVVQEAQKRFEAQKQLQILRENDYWYHVRFRPEELEED